MSKALWVAVAVGGLMLVPSRGLADEKGLYGLGDRPMILAPWFFDGMYGDRHLYGEERDVKGERIFKEGENKWGERHDEGLFYGEGVRGFFGERFMYPFGGRERFGKGYEEGFGKGFGEKAYGRGVGFTRIQLLAPGIGGFGFIQPPGGDADVWYRRGLSGYGNGLYGSGLGAGTGSTVIIIPGAGLGATGVYDRFGVGTGVNPVFGGRDSNTTDANGPALLPGVRPRMPM